MTDYSNLFGSGWRTPIIIATASPGLFSVGDGSNLVDGVTAEGGNWFANTSAENHYIKFEFPEPVIIDEAKYYQSDTSNQATWKWQGSNNDSDWTDIGSSFTLGGATVQTQTQLNGNTTAYKYYRLFGVSGSVNWNPYVREFEFKIDGAGSEETYYSSIGGGDRTATITVSGNNFSGTASNIVNGNSSPVYFIETSVADKYVKFDFGSGVVLTEAILAQSTTASHGTWKWQGSNNDSDWVDIGSSFTLGGATRNVLSQLSGNLTSYRYYRLLGISGTANGVAELREIYFESRAPGSNSSTAMALVVLRRRRLIL